MAWVEKQWARLRAWEKRNRVRGPDGDPDFKPRQPNPSDMSTGGNPLL